MKNIFKNLLSLLGYKLINKRNEIDQFDFVKYFDINTVIDIGASFGETTEMFYKYLPNANFYAFEPLLEPFKCLKELKNQIKNLQIYNCGLGDFEGTIEINVNEYSASSSIHKLGSLHKQMYPEFKEDKVEKIIINKLDSIFNKEKFHKELLVFIGCNGFENEVIEGGKATFLKAKIVIVKLAFTTMYENQPLFNDIYLKLVELGFKFQGILREGKRHPSTNTLVLIDAIFIRD
jgi:FkbM family methyltransferase